MCLDPKVVELINEHKGRLEHGGKLTIDPDDGYFSERNIKDNPNIFFKYLIFLFQSLEQLTQKAPFQLVPQFTMKRRSITLGKEQVAELMLRLSQTEETIESLGIDIQSVPNCCEVMTATEDRREERRTLKMAGHIRKRQRVQTLESDLLHDDLPVRKRQRTEHNLVLARKKLQECTDSLAKETVRTRKIPTGKSKEQHKAAKTVKREQWVQCHMRVKSHPVYSNHLLLSRNIGTE